MPLPNRRKDEKKSDFMRRCIDSLEKKDEFSDTKQRIAVCYRQLNKKKKTNS
jgi:hypothetical protein